MGSTFDYDWGAINQAFAAGKIGMYTSGSDVYTALVQDNGLNPDDYGLTVIPLGRPDAGVARRRHLAAVNVDDRPTTERDAAVKWIDCYYMQKLLDPGRRRRRRQDAQGQRPGRSAPRRCRSSTRRRTTQSRTWIKPYINVPHDQMTPFTDEIFDQPLVTEPTPHTQDLYAPLDPVVQAVLTDKNADIDALLDAGEHRRSRRSSTRAERATPTRASASPGPGSTRRSRRGVVPTRSPARARTDGHDRPRSARPPPATPPATPHGAATRAARRGAGSAAAG